MHLLPVILLSLLIDCVQTHLKSANIQTPKLKAHQTVFEFESREADHSAANILADNQCADPSTSDARRSEDVCELSRYKPHDTYLTRETSSLSYASHQNAKNDDQKYLTKIIPVPVETKEESAENLPAEDHIALDIQESQSSKNTSESSHPIQARDIATRPRARPVKQGWKTRSKFRTWIPRRKAPNRPLPKTRLPPNGKAPPKTSPTRKVETARRFRTPLKRTRTKSVFWRPKGVIRKKPWQKTARNRPNRRLGVQGRIEKPQKTTNSRRVVKPTNPLSTRRKNKDRKKHRVTKVNKNVPAPSKPKQGASALPQILPPVTPQPNAIPIHPTSSDVPPNSPPPNQNHVSPPPQPNAILINPAPSNISPNVPTPILNQESPPIPQTAPPVPSQPNRAQRSRDENVVQDPPASVLNNHILSHVEQENALPLVTSLDSSHDSEIYQSEASQQAGRIQPSRRTRTSRNRPSRSRAIQNHRSAPDQPSSQDDEIMEEAIPEEAEELDYNSREMPIRRTPSNGQSKIMHMSDLLFSTINTVLPQLLGNSEMRRSRNSEMENMSNGMMEGNDYSREMRGQPTDEFLYPNQDQPDLDTNKALEEPIDLRRPSRPRSGPLNPPYHDIEEENNGVTPYEPTPDPRPRSPPEHRANPTEPHSSRLAKSKRPKVRAQETENITNMRASNIANEETVSKTDEKSAKDPHDDDDDDNNDLENTYDEEDDDNSEDSSKIDSQADLELHHDTHTQLNSTSDQESKHKADSEPRYKLLNGTHIEGPSNSHNKTNTTTNLEVHPDMSTDTDHEPNDKPSVDVHTEIDPIANHETNHNSPTGAQSENGHNASHETKLEEISDNKLIDNDVNPANNTKDSLSGADGIDIEDVPSST